MGSSAICAGWDDPTFLDLQDKEDGLLGEIEQESIEELERHPILTINSKTTTSFDFPIGQTCRPTRVCAQQCYAKGATSPMKWRYQLLKRLRNWLYVRRADAYAVVARLIREFEAARRKAYRDGHILTFIRFLGSGDLFEELLPVVNEFARLVPNVLVWVPTRRFDLVASIEPYLNMRVLLSLDASTSANDLALAKKLATSPHVGNSFLKTAANQDTLGANIIYPVSDGLATDPRADCPVDAGRLQRGERGKTGYACAQCQRCLRPMTGKMELDAEAGEAVA